MSTEILISNFAFVLMENVLIVAYLLSKNIAVDSVANHNNALLQIHYFCKMKSHGTASAKHEDNKNNHAANK